MAIGGGNNTQGIHTYRYMQTHAPSEMSRLAPAEMETLSKYSSAPCVSPYCGVYVGAAFLAGAAVVL